MAPALEDVEFPVPPPDPPAELMCPECPAGPFKTPFALAGHRFGKHGIRGPRAEAKAAPKKRAPAKRSTRAEAKAADLEEIAERLADGEKKLGLLAGAWGMRVTSGYLLTTSDQFGRDLVALARHNPRLLVWLAKSSSAMDYVAVANHVAGLAVAVGVDLGRIPATGVVADQFGISEIVETIGLEDELAAAEPGEVFGAEANGGPVGLVPAPDLLGGSGVPSTPGMAPG